jgi:hypothetical protein
MGNRIRNFVESLIYAGMKPGARSAAGEPAKRGFFARFLDAPAASDPLYLTNRTFGQKAKRMLLLAAPVILVLAGGAAVFLTRSRKPEAAPKQLTAAEMAAKTLPAFQNPISFKINREIEVTEVHFDHGVMIGNFHNTTNHDIVQATVTFDLADVSNSQLGGVTVTELNLGPNSVRPFKRNVEQANAIYALVREVETR